MAIQHTITTPQGATHTKAYTRLDVKKSKTIVVDIPGTETADETYKLAWRLLIEVKTFVNEVSANNPSIIPLSVTSFWTDVVVGQDDQITAYAEAMKRPEFIKGIQV